MRLVRTLRSGRSVHHYRLRILGILRIGMTGVTVTGVSILMLGGGSVGIDRACWSMVAGIGGRLGEW